MPKFRLHKRPGFFWFLSALLILLAERLHLLVNFGFLHVDDDQAVLWFAAKELLSGRVNEVLFYGQNYGSNLEAWLSVPLIGVGVPYEKALPLITSFMTFCPFVLLCFYSVQRGQQSISLIPLLVLALMPIEFGMITTLPRGFVPGIFLASFLLLMFPSNPFAWLFVGYLHWLSLKASANVFPFLCCILSYTFLIRKPGLLAAVFTGMGFLAGLLHNRLIQVHIERHPENQMHFMWELDVDPGRIRLPELLHHFDHLSPVFSGYGWIWWVAFAAGFYVLRSRRHEQLILAGIFLLTFFSFTLNKTHHGYPNYSFSHARLFMYLPLVFAMVSKTAFEKVVRSPRSIIALMLCSVLVKGYNSEQLINKQLSANNYGGVHHEPVQAARIKCLQVDALVKQTGAGVILVGMPLFKHMITYACPCLLDSFPVTLAPFNDRRGWYLRRHQWDIPERVLILFTNQDSIRMEPGIRINYLNQDINWILVDHNKRPVFRLAEDFAMPFRSNQFFRWEDFKPVAGKR